MKLKNAIVPGLDWQIAYPVIEEAVKSVLSDHTGDGLTAKELIEACGLARAPKPHRARFFAALKALRKHGLADWFDVYKVASPYGGNNVGKQIQQFVYMPPSPELQQSRLQSKVDDLYKELTEAKLALSEFKGTQ